MQDTEEIWKDVPGYDGYYQISNRGRIGSFYQKNSFYKGLSKTIRILSPTLNGSGYKCISLRIGGVRKNMRIHTMVAMAFKGHIPNGKLDIVVGHLDDNKLNNNDWNLALITQRQNTSNRKHSSRYTGVSWDKTNKEWRADIRINGKSKYLGGFKGEERASIAYQNALKNIVGA